MRIVKYRGTTHGTNEYPFLIDEHGFTVGNLSSVCVQFLHTVAAHLR
jgi:circadian clock protein KaiC